MPETDTYATPECHGVVSEMPCPVNFAPTTRIEGNLLVESSTESSLGGNAHFEGRCSDDGCRPSGTYNFTVDGKAFDVNSAGIISLKSANSNVPNGKGSNIILQSGEGINPIGGSGGDVLIIAGKGSGGEGYNCFFAFDSYFVLF